MAEEELGGAPFAETQQEVAGGEVGEVTVPSANPLLKVQRAFGEIQHLVVVVRLEDEDVRQGHVVLDHLGRMPEVGQPGDAPGGVAILSRAIDGEADRVGGVVGDGDRGDGEPAELERTPRLEDLPVRSHLE